MRLGGPSLSLAQRVYLLVLAPLAVELAFIVVLINLMGQVEAVRLKEAHARDVVSHVNVLLRTLLGAGTNSVVGYMLSSRTYHKRYQELGEDFDRQAQIIKRLVAGNAYESRIFAEMESLNDLCMHSLALANKALEADDRPGAMRQWLKMHQSVEKIFVLADRLVEAEQSEQIKHSEEETKARENLKRLIVAMILFNLILAFVLVYNFNRSITDRLKTLMANANRLASGKPLLTLPGREQDEIKQLDRSFRNMAQALAEARENERAALENASEIIATIDGEGKFLTINPAVQALWGYAPEEVIGARLSLIARQEELKTLQDLLEKCRTSSVSHLEAGPGTEIKIIDKAGRTRDMSFSLNWSAERGTHHIVVHDISQKKEIERFKRDFVAMISHDLRTPLTSVNGFLSLLDAGAYGALPANGRQSLAIAIGNVERVITLVNDILEVEKLEQGLYAFDMEPLSLGLVREIALSCVQTVAETARHLDVSVQLVDEIKDSDSKNDIRAYSLLGDEMRLGQILLNLLGNAVKFSPRNETVQLRLALETIDGQTNLVLSVIDRGKGIPESQRESVWDRYKKLGDPKTNLSVGQKSYGFGLYIVKVLVAEHGGEFSITDGPDGTGTCFALRLKLQSIA